MLEEDIIRLVESIQRAHSAEEISAIVREHDKIVREEVVTQLFIRQSHFFVSVSHIQRRKICMSDFLYAESKRGYTDIYLAGIALPVTISHNLKWLQKELWDGHCLRISERPLVNCDHITSVHPYYTTLTLNNATELIIHPHYDVAIKRKLISFMHQQR